MNSEHAKTCATYRWRSNLKIINNITGLAQVQRMCTKVLNDANKYFCESEHLQFTTASRSARSPVAEGDNLQRVI